MKQVAEDAYIDQDDMLRRLRPSTYATRRLLARRYLRPAAWDARVAAVVRWAERR